MAQIPEKNNYQYPEEITRHLNLILNSTHEGIFGLDIHGHHTFVNPSAAKTLGYSVDELINQPSHKVWHHHHPDGTEYPESQCPIYETLRKGEAHSGEEWFIRKDGSFFPVSYSSNPIIENDEISGAVISFHDISEHFYTEKVKQSLIKGTSNLVGLVFFHELVENIAKALDVRYAFVGKLNPGLERIETIAVWAGDGFGDNFEYALANTPCENVVGKDLCSYPNRIQELFPEDKLLVAMEAQSYAGIPLFTSRGEPLGILAILDDKRLADESMARTLVSLFAGRAGAELERTITDQKLHQVLQQTVNAIAHTVEKRDPYTAGHQRRVADLAVAIGKAMGFDSTRLEGLRIGGIIHDLGKIHIPAEILTRPGKISNVEFSVIKTHPEVGYEIVKDIDFPWPIAKMVLQHHERLDGSGYPQGLKGKDIIQEAKILAVADVVEAITSQRPYRPGLGIEVALDEVNKNRGRIYDSDVVDVCTQLVQSDSFTW